MKSITNNYIFKVNKNIRLQNEFKVNNNNIRTTILNVIIKSLLLTWNVFDYWEPSKNVAKKSTDSPR